VTLELEEPSMTAPVRIAQRKDSYQLFRTACLSEVELFRLVIVLLKTCFVQHRSAVTRYG